MKKGFRRIALLLSLVLTVGLLAGCGKHEGSPLPEGMETEAVLAAGREIVTLLNNDGYEEILSRLRADVAAGGARPLTAKDIKQQTMDTLDKAGAYVSETEAMATGQKNKDSGEEFSEAVIFAKHEKKTVRYRIALDVDMTLIGIQVREY